MLTCTFETPNIAQKFYLHKPFFEESFVCHRIFIFLFNMINCGKKWCNTAKPKRLVGFGRRLLGLIATPNGALRAPPPKK
jgi:hypothetical protein